MNSSTRMTASGSAVRTHTDPPAEELRAANGQRPIRVVLSQGIKECVDELEMKEDRLYKMLTAARRNLDIQKRDLPISAFQLFQRDPSSTQNCLQCQACLDAEDGLLSCSMAAPPVTPVCRPCRDGQLCILRRRPCSGTPARVLPSPSRFSDISAAHSEDLNRVKNQMVQAKDEYVVAMRALQDAWRTAPPTDATTWRDLHPGQLDRRRRSRLEETDEMEIRLDEAIVQANRLAEFNGGGGNTREDGELTGDGTELGELPGGALALEASRRRVEEEDWRRQQDQIETDRLFALQEQEAVRGGAVEESNEFTARSVIEIEEGRGGQRQGSPQEETRMGDLSRPIVTSTVLPDTQTRSIRGGRPRVGQPGPEEVHVWHHPTVRGRGRSNPGSEEPIGDTPHGPGGAVGIARRVVGETLAGRHIRRAASLEVRAESTRESAVQGRYGPGDQDLTRVGPVRDYPGPPRRISPFNMPGIVERSSTRPLQAVQFQHADNEWVPARDFRTNRLWERMTGAIEEIEGCLQDMKIVAPASSQLRRLEMEIPMAEIKLDEYMESVEGEFDSMRGETRNEYMDRCSSNYRALSTRIKKVREGVRKIVPQDLYGVTGAARGNRKGNLARLTLPIFTGEEQKYGEFKRTFMELVEHEGLSDSIFLAYLKGSLPQEAMDLIAGISKKDEAMNRLDKRYGDKRTSVAIIKQQLRGLNVKKKFAHEQVGEIAQAVRRAQASAESIEGQEQFEIDYELVDCLARKLPTSTKERWYLYFEDLNEAGERRDNWTVFVKWLERQEKSAARQKLGDIAERLEDGKTSATGATGKTGTAPGKAIGSEVCSHCRKAGHSVYECREVRATAMGIDRSAREVITPDNMQRMAELDGEQNGPCPICKVHHMFDKKMRWDGPTAGVPATHQWPSQNLWSCPHFKNNLTPQERADTLERLKGCAICTSYLHQKEFCPQHNNWQGPYKCKGPPGGPPCGRWHHHSIHDTNSDYCHRKQEHIAAALKQSAARDPPKPALLELFEGECVGRRQNQMAVIFSDSGSTLTMIRDRFAQSLGLVGESTTLFLEVISGKLAPRPTKLYWLKLVDMFGESHTVRAYGMPSILNTGSPPDLTAIKHLFPSAPTEIFQRPVGPVDILLGKDNRRLQARQVDQEDLGLSLIDFGCGYVLNGHHTALSFEAPRISSVVAAFSRALTEIPKGAQVLALQKRSPEWLRLAEAGLLDPRSGRQSKRVRKQEEETEKAAGIKGLGTEHKENAPPLQFFEAEELGCSPEPKCSSCKGCKLCGNILKNLSRDDQARIEAMQGLMQLDEEANKLTVSYPFTSKIERMADNWVQARAMQKNIEERLIKKGRIEEYDAELEKALQQGSIIELTEREMREYEGPSHFIQVFDVLNDKSASTPLRVVANSKMKNAVADQSLNECIMPAPNAMNDMLDVLIHFRMVQCALVADFTKAYQSIHTTEKEMHLRKFFWRRGRSKDWKIFAYVVMAFGDLPAATFLELAKRLAAQKGWDIDPVAAIQIILYCFVDDGCFGGSMDDVIRMRGELRNGEYDGTIARIMKKVGIKLKFAVIAGKCTEEEARLLGGKVLGLQFCPYKDEITMAARPRLTETISKTVRSEVELTEREIEQILTGERKWTRRDSLSFLMSQFDPMGLIAPIILEGKILLRRLFGPGPNKGWDDLVPEEERKPWRDYLLKVLKSRSIQFPRRAIPDTESVEKWLVVFSDGSTSAYAGAAYILSRREQAPHSRGRLLLAKAKVTPVAGTSVPRSELQGLVVATRLAVTVTEAILEPLDRVVLLTDSACTAAVLQKTGSQLLPFAANRLSEMAMLTRKLREKTKVVEEVAWIPGDQNPADYATRGGICSSLLGAESEWQLGAPFLALDRDRWPTVIASKKEGKVPDEELKTKHEVIQARVMAAKAFTAEQNRVEVWFAAEYSSKTEVNGWTMGVRMYDGRGAAHFWSMVEELMICGAKWNVTVGALARVLRALFRRGRRDLREAPRNEFEVRDDLEAKDYASAREIQFKYAGQASVRALREGRLTSIDAREVDGEVWMSGRLTKEDWERLVGVRALRVIMPDHPLASLIVRHCHDEAHRLGVRACVATTKRYAWIPGATRLAKSIIKRCMFCARKRARYQKQMMAELPRERLEQAAPFEITALDLFGPFVVKAIAGRVRVKVWVIMFVCLSTRGVAMVPVKGYDAASFMLGYDRFCGTYGIPSVIYCDQGSQLKAASERDDWRSVANVTSGQGTSWKFSPVASSWYNGLAERAIRSAREQLEKQLSEDGRLNYVELDTLLTRVAFIINDRPLAASLSLEDDIVTICPNDILLGRISRARGLYEPSLKEDPDRELQSAISTAEEMARGWWAGWIVQVLPDLTPRTKWRREERNVAVGDIALLGEKSRLGRPQFQMVRVAQLHPDKKGQVRRITVKIVDRRKKGAAARFIQVGVQRIAVFLPKEEQSMEKTGLSMGGGQLPQRSPSGKYVRLRRPGRVGLKDYKTGIAGAEKESEEAVVKMCKESGRRCEWVYNAEGDLQCERCEQQFKAETLGTEESLQADGSWNKITEICEEDRVKTGRPCPVHEKTQVVEQYSGGKVDEDGRVANEGCGVNGPCKVHDTWIEEEEELEGRYGPIGQRVFVCSCNVEIDFWTRSPEKSPHTPRDCPNSPPVTPRLVGGFMELTVDGLVPISKTVVRHMGPGANHSSWD